ncbi:MAG: hypothetical protein H0T62_07455 [Parachlamydiaceae bacterium]|nr:hypothetical protein [Parachlamydiaceae bacterium]
MEPTIGRITTDTSARTPFITKSVNDKSGDNKPTLIGKREMASPKSVNNTEISKNNKEILGDNIFVNGNAGRQKLQRTSVVHGLNKVLNKFTDKKVTDEKIEEDHEHALAASKKNSEKVEDDFSLVFNFESLPSITRSMEESHKLVQKLVPKELDSKFDGGFDDQVRNGSKK